MLNLAIDSKLRGCDVVSLRVENVCRLLSPRQKEPADVLDGLRTAEEITLHFGAPQRANLLQLWLCFDAFGSRYYIEATGEAGDGPHDCNRGVLIRKAAGEGTIDLDFVKREAAQIAQRRVSGAKVIHGDPHP